MLSLTLLKRFRIRIKIKTNLNCSATVSIRLKFCEQLKKFQTYICNIVDVIAMSIFKN